MKVKKFNEIDPFDEENWDIEERDNNDEYWVVQRIMDDVNYITVKRKKPFKFKGKILGYNIYYDVLSLESGVLEPSGGKNVIKEEGAWSVDKEEVINGKTLVFYVKIFSNLEGKKLSEICDEFDIDIKDIKFK